MTLVNTLRGSFSSGNPSKAAYQYPRPWRMNEDSVVVDTGTIDEFGYPVYDSPVVVAAQLLRQRSTTPADDGGFPSGHTNAFHLAALASAYAIPERFQELVTAAFDLAETRIVAGMHSPVDVIGASWPPRWPRPSSTTRRTPPEKPPRETRPAATSPPRSVRTFSGTRTAATRHPTPTPIAAPTSAW